MTIKINRPVSASLLPLTAVGMSGKTLAAPFVARQNQGVAGVEAHADAAFRNLLLTFAPPGPRKHFLDGLRNGPQGDHGAHARRYFGEDKIQAISEQTSALVDLVEVAFATRCDRPGFKRWLGITDFGNDYRMIKGFLAWSELKKAEDAKHAAEMAVSANG